MLGRYQNIKTVIIIHDYGDVRGGQEKVAIDSALGLKKAGLDVVFFCATGPTDLRLELSGIRTVSLGRSDLRSNPSKFNAVKNGLWDASVAIKLKMLLEQYDPKTTVLHVHGWTKALSASVIPVLTAENRRHVYTMHEYFLACPNGGFFNYKDNKICNLTAMGGRCIGTNCDQRSYSHKLFRVARQAIANKRAGLLRNLRNIICISDLQKSVISPYLSKESKLHYVPNPISVTQQDRVKAEENGQIVFVGRLEPVKGAVDLAQAASDISLSVKFVGDGSQADLIRQVNPNFEITGWVSPECVYSHLRQARCLAFPSLWYECQPLVPYEALAMGIPVVSYDLSAARESINPGINGEIVPHKDGILAFRDVLKSFESMEFVQKRSLGAYESYWAAPLTLDRHVENLLKVYETA